MSGSDIALIITALGAIVTGPVMTVWARFDAKKTEAKKEAEYAKQRAERDAVAEAGRVAARESLSASLVSIEKKQDEVHVLVDGKSSRQEAKIDEQGARIEGLRDVIAGAKKKR